MSSDLFLTNLFSTVLTTWVKNGNVFFISFTFSFTHSSSLLSELLFSVCMNTSPAVIKSNHIVTRLNFYRSFYPFDHLLFFYKHFTRTLFTLVECFSKFKKRIELFSFDSFTKFSKVYKTKSFAPYLFRSF